MLLLDQIYLIRPNINKIMVQRAHKIRPIIGKDPHKTPKTNSFFYNIILLMIKNKEEGIAEEGYTNKCT